ncbi:MAG: SGNH/GDSL hydrolase family protein [Coraliomargaritaceae bacterium]
MSSYSFDDYDPLVMEELRIRQGLPNFFHKLASEKTLRIAYVGGSITLAEGWRVKSFAWLEDKYPEVDFIQINAAIGGTGADFGLCRLEEHVLSHQPDLVFVEYRVNGGGDHPNEAFEGLIRRIREANRETDICFVYTIGEWMLPNLLVGRQAYYGVMLEEVANHYGIPSIDFGVDIIQLLQAEQLMMNVSKRPKGKIWFSKDPCHPTDEGHELYLKTLARSLEKIALLPHKPYAHNLPNSLYSNNFNKGRFIPVASAQYSDGWKAVDVEKDPIYTDNLFRTNAMLGQAMKCADVGESITFDWEGRFLCMTHIPQKSGIEVSVSVDGQEPEVFTFEQSSENKLHARFFYLKEQPPGKHTATLTVTKLPDGLVYFAGQCLELCPE